MKSGNYDSLHNLINKNFDIRKQLMPISKMNQQLIDLARKCGVCAKFTGSGGAIIGIFKNDSQIRKLKKAMNEIGANVIIPKVVES